MTVLSCNAISKVFDSTVVLILDGLGLRKVGINDNDTIAEINSKVRPTQNGPIQVAHESLNTLEDVLIHALLATKAYVLEVAVRCR